jgi:Fis family transcriptional regulator
VKRPARKDAATAEPGMGEPLRECVRKAMDKYFSDLDGERPGGLYQLVLAEVERPLLESVMQHARGNQSHAADYLGISRSTLRKKLKHYQID